MSERLNVAKILDAKTGTERGKVFIGFDGNTDELLDVVETRGSADDYKAMETMDVMGMRIVKAAGKSCNIELVPRQTKVGGNGPILCSALVEGEHDVTLVGCLGQPEIEPLFDELIARCESVFSFAPSGYTQALEFEDGKVMLGKLEAFKQVSWDNLLKLIPLNDLIALHDKLDLFVSANWTMMLHIHTIWQGIVDHVMPKLSPKTRWMFVDLADPAKRTDEDLHECLRLLSELARGYKIVLGLNHSEEGRVAEVVGVASEAGGKENVARMAAGIREKIGIEMVVCHSTQYAVVAHAGGYDSMDGPYIDKPAIKTGAGDNFNAGFCNGLIHGMTPLQCLVSAVGGSGFYVREGHSPTMKELAQFLRLWQANQL